jgi:NADH:ubiquinone oxidoreductase subunit 4 (subunit M)
MPIFYLINLLLFFILFLSLLSNKYLSLIRNLSLLVSSVIFLIVLILVLKFDISNSMLQWSLHISWSGFLNIYYSGGVDGV